MIANATGCSSIYGANLPTTPWAADDDGHGPAWANSLFEDNAEFGYGMRVALDQRGETDKSVWIIGGDGWAYDIGYSGLDHILASGRNVNVLVLDTEVYSNTGGQASKATPRGAVAKFASGGKRQAKKDLGMIAASYGGVYVAQIALGANYTQTIKALQEAEAWEGPSLVIAYSTCIAHGIEMGTSMTHQKDAVRSGYWPLYRYHPGGAEHEHPFHLDSKPPSIPVSDFTDVETRFSMLMRKSPDEAKRLAERAQDDVDERWRLYQQLASVERSTRTEDL
jgi:pyruvate-ferredoxin/flavodoxin oxidoreductase